MEIITKQQLAEFTVRPLDLEPDMQSRMITRLSRLTDEELANAFRKGCGLNVCIVSTGHFMFRY